MEKEYRLMGTNRRGECKTATIRTSRRPNTKAWLAEVIDEEMWGATFMHYRALPYGDTRAIKAH